MLSIIRNMSALRFSDLMEVYREGNLENGAELYSRLSPMEQLANAEQDFYHYLNSVFFRQKESFYAVWACDSRYMAALRLEPYLDGLLLCALETAPTARRMGYATELVLAVQKYLAEKGSGTIYSHVSKKNIASLGVHKKCGFTELKDHAVYADGSVHRNYYTLIYQYEKSEIF